MQACRQFTPGVIISSQLVNTQLQDKQNHLAAMEFRIGQTQNV